MVKLADLMTFMDQENDLEEILERHAREGELEIDGETAGPDTRIGAMFIEVGLLERDQLDRLMEKQNTLNRRIGEMLVEEGLVERAQMEQLLRIQLRLKEAFASPGGAGPAGAPPGTPPVSPA